MGARRAEYVAALDERAIQVEIEGQQYTGQRVARSRSSGTSCRRTRSSSTCSTTPPFAT